MDARSTDPDGDRHSRVFHAAIVLAFLGVLAAPWLDRRPVSARSPEMAEKRLPAPAPELALDFDALNAYPRKFERHFGDTFGFRDRFLRGHSLVKLFGFGVSPTPTVLVGRDGWLFFTGSRTVEDVRGLVPFSAGELVRWREMLEQRSRLLAERGSHYVYVIVPNKEEMYPERLPAHLRQLGERRIDQFVEHMRAHSDVDVLDLREALRAARAHEDPDVPLYVRLGTHWNGPGSVVATRAIVEHLAPRFPGLRPLPAELRQELVLPTHGDTWGRSMYVDDLLPQRIVDYRPPADSVEVLANTGTGLGSDHAFRGPDPARPRAVLVHDSFGPYLWPLLSWSFSELHALWRGPFPWDDVIELAPDVVIEEHVQRWFLVNRPTLFEGGGADGDFLSAPHALLDLVLPADAARFEARGNVSMRPAADGDGAAGGLELAANSRRDLVALPPVEVPAGSRLALRIVYSAPRDTRVALFQGPASAERPELRDGVRRDAPAGEGVLYATVAAPPGARRLFLRPPPRPATLVLRRVEVRATAP